jgi:uncharacterized protein with FMN-binding domain
MRFTRLVRTVVSCAILIALAGALAACAVNKAELARRMDLRDVDLKLVPDGAYEASYTIAPPPPAMAANKSVRVRVTVTGGKYSNIEILKPPRIGENKTFEALIARVVETQSLSIDAVSAATITSAAVLKAIQNAVSSPGN